MAYYITTNPPPILTNFKIEHDEVKIGKKNQSLSTPGIGILDTKEWILRDEILDQSLDSNLISVGGIIKSGAFHGRKLRNFQK